MTGKEDKDTPAAKPVKKLTPRKLKRWRKKVAAIHSKACALMVECMEYEDENPGAEDAMQLSDWADNIVHQTESFDDALVNRLAAEECNDLVNLFIACGTSVDRFGFRSRNLNKETDNDE